MINFASLKCTKTMHNTNYHSLLATLLLLVSINCFSDTPTPTIHGFINQGIIKTSENSYFGDSKDYSSEFTSAALGISWRPLPKLQLSAQAIYSQAGATSRDDVYIDYALIDYTLAQGTTWRTGVRAGRIKNPYGFYNESRDVATTRSSIMLPESIYRNFMRDLVHTSDSVSFYGHSYIGEHLVQIDLLKGDAIIGDATENDFTGALLSGEIGDNNMEIARIMTESYGGRLKLAYTYTEIKNTFTPDPGNVMGVPLNGFPGKSRITLEIYSAEVNWDRWQFSAEYQEFDLKSKGIFSPNGSNSTPSGGYYVSASYEIQPRLHVFLRHDVFHRNLDDKRGKKYSARTSFPDHNAFFYDNTLGIRYQHDRNWLFAAEIHDITGSGSLSVNENNLRQAKKDWTLFTAQISYQF